MKALAHITALALCGVCACACSESGAVNAAPYSGSRATLTDSATGLPTDVDAGVRQAEELRNKGSYPQAAQILSRLMLVAPDDARVITEYGKVMVQEGRTQDAQAFLKRAAQLQPNDWTIFSAMGVTYDLGGDYANAKLAYEHALMLQPGNAVIYNNYAMSRVQAGDVAGAQNLMARAQGAGSSDPKIAANAQLVASLTGSRAPVAAQAAPAVAHPVAVASAPIPPAHSATAAPRQMVASGQVVMQKVPVDPKAGPVKPRRIAHAAPATKSPAALAANTPKLRVGTDGLRADASAP